MIWTEEAIDRVRHLAEIEGLTTGQIAKELNLTRNTISGVIARHAIHLKFRPVNQNAKRNRIVKEKRIKPKPSKEHIMIIESYVPPVEQRLSLMELKSHSCRWPLGDGPGYFFCGGISLDGKPYCAIHSAMAYTRVREVYDPTRKRDRNSI